MILLLSGLLVFAYFIASFNALLLKVEDFKQFLFGVDLIYESYIDFQLIASCRKYVVDESIVFSFIEEMPVSKISMGKSNFEYVLRI